MNDNFWGMFHKSHTKYFGKSSFYSALLKLNLSCKSLFLLEGKTPTSVEWAPLGRKLPVEHEEDLNHNEYIFKFTMSLSLLVVGKGNRKKGDWHPVLPRTEEFACTQDFLCYKAGYCDGRERALFRDIRPL